MDRRGMMEQIVQSLQGEVVTRRQKLALQNPRKVQELQGVTEGVLRGLK